MRLQNPARICLVSALLVAMPAVAQKASPQVSPAEQGRAGGPSITVFCETTIPSYAAAYREGYREIILQDLFKDPSFKYLTPDQKEAFVQLLDSASELTPDQARATCKELVTRTLSLLSVPILESCRTWGSTAELLLRSIRAHGERNSARSLDEIEEDQPLGVASLRPIYQAALRARPEISPERFGEAFYQQCLEALIQRGSEDS